MSLALPSLFAPAISYLALIAGGEVTTIWSGERFEKQTLRNRADFLSPSGVVSISIPVARFGYPTPTISNIHISEHGNWRPKLKYALTSAYSSTPYWEHYEDLIIESILYNESDLLIDFNYHWLKLFCDVWELDTPNLSPSLAQDEEFHPEFGDNHYIQTQQRLPRYWQVFEQEFGFIPGLSSLDLLLSQGPEGRLYLKDVYDSF